MEQSLLSMAEGLFLQKWYVSIFHFIIQVISEVFMHMKWNVQILVKDRLPIHVVCIYSVLPVKLCIEICLYRKMVGIHKYYIIWISGQPLLNGNAVGNLLEMCFTVEQYNGKCYCWSTLVRIPAMWIYILYKQRNVNQVLHGSASSVE